MAKFASVVLDNSGKFAASVVDTGGNYAAGVIANLPPVSLILVVHLNLRKSRDIVP